MEPFPVRIPIYGGTDEQARALVRSLNEHRRHLTVEQRKESARQLHEANPSMSASEIAAQTNISRNTVLSATGQNDRLRKSNTLTRRNGVTITVYRHSAMEPSLVRIHIGIRRGSAQPASPAVALLPLVGAWVPGGPPAWRGRAVTASALRRAQALAPYGFPRSPAWLSLTLPLTEHASRRLTTGWPEQLTH